MPRCADDMEGIFFKGFYLEAFARGGKGDEADISLSCEDRFVDFVGATIIDLNFDARIGAEKIFDVWGEFVEAEAGDGDEADGP